jgi:hypothetical protein
MSALLFSCGKRELSPRETAARFLHLAKGNEKEKALELVLPDDKDMLQRVEDSVSRLSGLDMKNDAKIGERLDYWSAYSSIDTFQFSLQVSLEGQIQLFYRVHHANEIEYRRLKLTLVQERGRWYIDLPVPRNAPAAINAWIDEAGKGHPIPDFSIIFPDYARIYVDRDSLAAQSKRKAVTDSLKLDELRKKQLERVKKRNERKESKKK